MKKVLSMIVAMAMCGCLLVAFCAPALAAPEGADAGIPEDAAASDIAVSDVVDAVLTEDESAGDPILDVISAGVKLVLAAISAVVTIIVVPFLKNTVIPWLEEKHLRSLIAGLVQGAEQKGDAGQIAKQAKKEYVLGLLRARGIEITEEIDNMVEAAVLGLDDSFAKVLKALIGEDDTVPGTGEGPGEAPADGKA